MWSLINIKETVNMQMWYLIEIFIFKSQGYLKLIYLVIKVQLFFDGLSDPLWH